ncbi:class I SAM-dependent methyltransferase [Candidatus Parcubacteria bacterium]|nr:class I SAM-dependent methyltransferase [Patescibacteria group bacterium]MCG2694389.1 class I SAM-dependent methyltransferase [Candidatus Parcubacteria bacterium]
MEKETALKIIEKNRESYNNIAKEFDASRQYSWLEFDLCAPYIKKESNILDIGCGNGRLYEHLITNYKLLITKYTGVDQSEELIKIAQKNYPDTNFKTIKDVRRLQFEDGEFDFIAGIAFLHHIPDGEMRLEVLKEVYRVLAPGGTLFLINWNLWQWRLIKKYKLHLRDFFYQHNDLDAGDFWINFQGTPRYYHHFTKSGLVRLCKKAGFKLLSCKKGKNMILVLSK